MMISLVLLLWRPRCQWQCMWLQTDCSKYRPGGRANEDSRHGTEGGSRSDDLGPSGMASARGNMERTGGGATFSCPCGHRNRYVPAPARARPPQRPHCRTGRGHCPSRPSSPARPCPSLVRSFPKPPCQPRRFCPRDYGKQAVPEDGGSCAATLRLSFPLLSSAFISPSPVHVPRPFHLPFPFHFHLTLQLRPSPSRILFSFPATPYARIRNGAHHHHHQHTHTHTTKSSQ